MPAPKKPADRKPKAGAEPGSYAAADGRFTFVGLDGEAYRLPPATDSLERLDLGTLLDAATGGEAGQVMLAVQALAVADLDDATRTALRALPLTSGSAVMGAWFSATSKTGVSVPQS